jgi:hypothetical protein
MVAISDNNVSITSEQRYLMRASSEGADKRGEPDLVVPNGCAVIHELVFTDSYANACQESSKLIRRSESRELKCIAGTCSMPWALSQSRSVPLGSQSGTVDALSAICVRSPRASHRTPPRLR